MKRNKLSEEVMKNMSDEKNIDVIGRNVYMWPCILNMVQFNSFVFQLVLYQLVPEVSKQNEHHSPSTENGFVHIHQVFETMTKCNMHRRIVGVCKHKYPQSNI
jgi:hypothetical protein